MNIENIFIQIPSFVFWKNTDSQFLGCNLYFAQAAGFNCPSEIIGKTDFDLAWGDTHAELYQEGDQKILEGALFKNIIEPQLQTDNKTISILINKMPLLNSQGQKIGVIGSYTEIRDPLYHGNVDSLKNNIALTKKQAECLLHLASGITAKEIADKMGVSVRTAEYHINLLKKKMKCINKAGLIAKAMEFDFIKIRLFSNKE